MNAIQKEYLILFNAVTDTVDDLLTLRRRLINAQKLAEETYIESDDTYDSGNTNSTT
ncbi:MAG: hypothetical protein AB7D36_06115 [Oscillospiraceae bacterium]